ncbi:hypothetical protein EJ04DRAFT_451979 [Polyplosphaeria fusca]|uniref:Methyltransferase domain-containing protein n=1 Tax=Polyplosphaeria fusca TaxID=682080 RepID=A0A9P4QLP2_9PLEO|nr:hypothetical protein EJ04DRAFT_451979 [Polyplosphaeria fusca]
MDSINEPEQPLALPELSVEWIKNTKLLQVPELAKKLLTEYAKVPSGYEMSHIKTIRDQALETFPYPCIGHYRFLDLQIVKSKVYDEIVTRVKRGQCLMDVGCCIGQELRQVVHDGAPSTRLYGIDLYAGFFDVGFDLFRDRESFQGHFLAADMFEPSYDLARLEGSADIIWTGNVLHLFDWDGQIAAMEFMLKLLNPGPGSLIAGRFMGHSKSGEYRYNFRGGLEIMYRHNEKSFRRLFQTIIAGTSETWEVDVASPDWHETLQLRRSEDSDPTWTVEVKFVARRVQKLRADLIDR